MTSVVPEGGGLRRGQLVLVVGIVAAGSLAPLALYGLFCGRISTLTPAEAKQLLQPAGAPAVLVDVRPPAAFSAGHIDGAENWPLEAILATTQPGQLPPQFHGKRLLLVCDVGMASRRATWHLGRLGVDGASNVRGGIQEWMRSAPGATGSPLDRWRLGSGRVVEFPFRHSPLREQSAAVGAFFLVKPLYTALALAVAIVLWQMRSLDLAALRWGMIFFFLGENACAINYFLFKETSYLFEYLHSLGMLLCFGFTTYAVLQGIDGRILMLSDPQRRCAALRLCGACSKHAPVPCGLKRAFYWFIPALIVVALMLPTADWQDNSYNTLIFGAPYNYAHLRVYQQLENWYCAGAAILLLGASLVILALKRKDAIGTAKITFAGGVGPLAFGMLRMVLGGAYDQNRVWYLFWEEATELLFIAGICFMLWTFRRGLLGPAAAANEAR